MTADITHVTVAIARSEAAYESMGGWLVGVFADADTAREKLSDWVEDEDYELVEDEPVSK